MLTLTKWVVNVYRSAVNQFTKKQSRKISRFCLIVNLLTVATGRSWLPKKHFSPFGVENQMENWWILAGTLMGWSPLGLNLCVGQSSFSAVFWRECICILVLKVHWLADFPVPVCISAALACRNDQKCMETYIEIKDVLSKNLLYIDDKVISRCLQIQWNKDFEIEVDRDAWLIKKYCLIICVFFLFDFLREAQYKSCTSATLLGGRSSIEYIISIFSDAGNVGQIKPDFFPPKVICGKAKLFWKIILGIVDSRFCYRAKIDYLTVYYKMDE